MTFHSPGIIPDYDISIPACDCCCGAGCEFGEHSESGDD